MSREELFTSQLGITSGVRQNDSDFIVTPDTAKSKRRSARRGKLWIITEAAAMTGGAGAAAKLVMEAVEDEYYGSSAPSILTALDAAVQAANRLLHDYNSGAPVHKQAFLGLTCIVVHNREAYIAQVQPSRLVLIHQGKSQFIPDGEPQSEADLAPLGLDTRVEVELQRCPFTPGDMFAVASTRLSVHALRNKDGADIEYKGHAEVVEEIARTAARSGLLDEHALVVEYSAPSSRSRPSFHQLGRQVLSQAPSAIQWRRGRPAAAAAGSNKPRFAWPAANRDVRTLARTAGSRRVRRGTGIVGAVVLLLLVSGLAARAYQGYQRSASLNALIAAAEKERSQARGKPAETALQYLQSAREYLVSAQKIEPGHARVRSLLRGLDVDRATVNRVVRVPQVTTLATLSGTGTGARSKLVIAEGRALVLGAAGRAYMYDLKRSRASALQPASSSKLVGLSWRTGGVIVLDAKGKVYDYEYKTGNWSSVGLAGKYDWKSVTSFDSYGTQAFVSIKGVKGVLRYDLAAAGPAKLLKASSAKQPLVPTSVSADGNLWISNGLDDSLWQMVSGRLRRRLWVDAQPRVQGIRGLVAVDGNQYLYMLDGVGNRVLKVTAAGALEAQYQFPRVAGAGRIDAVYGDEGAKRVYILAGQKLMFAPMSK